MCLQQLLLQQLQVLLLLLLLQLRYTPMPMFMPKAHTLCIDPRSAKSWRQAFCCWLATTLAGVLSPSPLSLFPKSPFSPLSLPCCLCPYHVSSVMCAVVRISPAHLTLAAPTPHVTARREPHWWEDTDKPKAAESIFKRLAQQWSKISARSDEVRALRCVQRPQARTPACCGQ